MKYLNQKQKNDIKKFKETFDYIDMFINNKLYRILGNTEIEVDDSFTGIVVTPEKLLDILENEEQSKMEENQNKNKNKLFVRRVQESFEGIL